MSQNVDEQKKASLHAAIEKMPKGSVELLLNIVSELTSTKKEIKTVFLVRAFRALIALVEGVPVEEATAAPTDYDLLLTLLQQPEALQALPSMDPLASSRLRGLMAKKQLLVAEGGCMSSTEVAEILGISRQGVDKRRNNSKLIGLPKGRTYVYPAWQFGEGETLSGLEEVLNYLNVRDPWMQTAWMLNGNSRLEGKSPLEVLRAGNREAAINAAEIYGEQGAA